MKELSDRGYVIGCHSWDHHAVTTYKEHDWKIQLIKPTALLEEITGKPVKYFAYPYGIWNAEAIDKMKEQGYKGAFQLYGKIDTANKSYAIRRIIADGNLDAQQLSAIIKKSFK